MDKKLFLRVQGSKSENRGVV